jgi:hypothetical protein
MTNSLRIFISYAREDATDLALKLRDDLRAVGHSAWLDQSEIVGGANWSQAIERAIEVCDVALTLLSPGSYRSQYCRAEQLRAIRKGKRVVPILVVRDSEIPLHLEHLNYLDFSELARYSAMLRDLLSDLNAGRAFAAPPARDDLIAAPFKPPRPTHKPVIEKRDAAAFRRHLAELRAMPWLGARYWWPYFLFAYADLTEIAQTLRDGSLRAPARRRGASTGRWDESVRLFFRPRTPDLWSSEGIRPARSRRAEACHMPVYLLFDMEAVICQPEARFSAGDPAQTRKTNATSSAFGELPFELIYHDTVVRQDEMAEVMLSRRAQVIVPDPLGLEALQLIWCRSEAEYETLRTLLPPDVWGKWRDKITARTDFSLFNRRGTFVSSALLTAARAYLVFHATEDAGDDVAFDVRAELTLADGAVHRWAVEGWRPGRDLVINLDGLPTRDGYTLHVYLDDALAYANRYQGDLVVL